MLDIGVMHDGLLHTSMKGKDLEWLYKKFREAFMDGKLSVKKPIGFKITNAKQSLETIAVSRSSLVLESQIELSKNISKLVICGNSAIQVKCTNLKGKIYAGNLNITSDNRSVKVLDPSVFILTAMQSLDLNLVIYPNSGFHLIEDNVEIMRDECLDNKQNIGSIGGELVHPKADEYYPLNTDHSLIDYIRIIPFDSHRIKYTITNNVRDEDLNNLWQSYREELENDYKCFNI